MKNIYYNLQNNITLKVIFNIEKNKVILFDLSGVMFTKNTKYGDDNTKNRDYTYYTEKERKQILKEFINIVNSLKKINSI